MTQTPADLPLERTISNSSTSTVRYSRNNHDDEDSANATMSRRSLNGPANSNSGPWNAAGIAAGAAEVDSVNGQQQADRDGRGERDGRKAFGSYYDPNYAQGQGQQPAARTTPAARPRPNTSNQQTNPPERTRPASPTNQPSPDQPWGGPFPSLHLWPLNETFTTKMIHLPPFVGRSTTGEKIKIGRQTNVKTVPHERNGCFDSKVLSRVHAEVWSEQGSDGTGRIFIRDVKSSNGTFVNGERLSGESQESEPYALKSEDVVEFGIDIVSEDQKTVVHHKVSCKVYCVFNVDDAGLSARELGNYYPYDQSRSIGPTRKGPNTVPPSGGLLPSGMMSAGGKGHGLNFDHVLAKLQSELERSKETGAELQTLASHMNGIQETLSGGIAPDENGKANEHIPPQFRPHEDEPIYVPGIPDHAVGDPTATIAALQAQLSNTQAILISHKDRIRSLETLLNEQESIKDEVLGLRQQIETSKLEFESMVQSLHARGNSDEEDETGDSPQKDRRLSSTKSLSDDRSILSHRSSQLSLSNRSVSSSSLKAKGNETEISLQTSALSARLDALSADLEAALELSRNLQRQHAEATSTVKLLEDKVVSLERDMANRVTDAAGQAGRNAEDRWDTWKTKFEEGWRKEREGWELERERLRGVVREWEEASRRAQEEEEERLMNGRLSGESETDEDSEGEENHSAHPGRRASHSDSDWVVPRSSHSDGGQINSPSLRRMSGHNSHPSSPRSASAFEANQLKIRRESSSRLDPAIRALRAAAGEPGNSNGSSTPRIGTSAEGALGALKSRANGGARGRRVPTLMTRRRKSNAQPNQPPSKTGETKQNLAASESAQTVIEFGQTREGEDDRSHESHGESTGTESDETAHEEHKSDSEKDKEKSKAVKAEAGKVIRPLGAMGQHPIPFAVSVAIVGVAAWAYIHRIKE